MHPSLRPSAQRPTVYANDDDGKHTFSFVFSFTSLTSYPPLACGACPAVLFLTSPCFSAPVVMASSRTAIASVACGSSQKEKTTWRGRVELEQVQEGGRE